MCVRGIWGLLSPTDEVSRTAVEIAERFADGDASEDEVEAAGAASRTMIEALLEGTMDAVLEAGWKRSSFGAWAAALGATARPVSAETTRAAKSAEWEEKESLGDYQTHHEPAARQAFTLCEIVGNPFETPKFVPTWVTIDVRTLAETMYEDRHLPSGKLDCELSGVLADALEEAGCDDADILNHLRSPAPHVRGCWVVDLLLGKEWSLISAHHFILVNQTAYHDEWGGLPTLKAAHRRTDSLTPLAPDRPRPGAVGWEVVWHVRLPR
jgi:hypothetical protein